MVNAVEESTYICIQYPVDVLAQALLAKLIQCIVRPASVAKTMREIVKFLLIYDSVDLIGFYETTLLHIVFHAGCDSYIVYTQDAER